MAKIKGTDDELWRRANATYIESEDVSALGADAQNAYNSLKNWQGSADAEATLNKWKNYGAFNYDPNSDPLYQNARANAISNGKIATDDTIGKASAMTGGYGNSYAVTAGSQAYQNYLSSLDDDLATYYQLALDQYQQGKDDLLTQYQIESDIDDANYSRLYNEYGLAADRYNAARSFDYGRHSDDVSRAATLAGMQNSDYWTQENMAEDTRRRDEEFAESKRQYDANLAESKRQYDLSLTANTPGAGDTRRLSAEKYAERSELYASDDWVGDNKKIYADATALYASGALTEEDYVAVIENFIDIEWLEKEHVDVFLQFYPIEWMNKAVNEASGTFYRG